MKSQTDGDERFKENCLRRKHNSAALTEKTSVDVWQPNECLTWAKPRTKTK